MRADHAHPVMRSPYAVDGSRELFQQNNRVFSRTRVVVFALTDDSKAERLVELHGRVIAATHFELGLVGAASSAVGERVLE
jgi:hypothetical protein